MFPYPSLLSHSLLPLLFFSLRVSSFLSRYSVLPSFDPSFLRCSCRLFCLPSLLPPSTISSLLTPRPLFISSFLLFIRFILSLPIFSFYSSSVFSSSFLRYFYFSTLLFSFIFFSLYIYFFSLPIALLLSFNPSSVRIIGLLYTLLSLLLFFQFYFLCFSFLIPFFLLSIRFAHLLFFDLFCILFICHFYTHPPPLLFLPSILSSFFFSYPSSPSLGLEPTPSPSITSFICCHFCFLSFSLPNLLVFFIPLRCSFALLSLLSRSLFLHPHLLILSSFLFCYFFFFF